MNGIVIASDQLLAGFTVGITIWHFFLQAPFLMKLMGKEKFVPIMMQLTRLWIQTIFISSTLLLATSFLLLILQEQPPISSFSPLSRFHYCALVAWMAVAINKFVIVPKALKAGARSRDQRKGDNTSDVKDFAVQGGGKSETARLHQTVVVFVVVMTVALLVHMVDLSSSSTSLRH